MDTPVLAGAEPMTATGGPVGVLVIHGFTGSPQSMRPLAERFAAAGYSVEMPLLPGHGTSVEEMARTGWADWSSAAQEALNSLRARCERVAVAGLSMGGGLATWLAANNPDVIAAVLINPAVVPAPVELIEPLKGLIDGGMEFMPGIGSDIAAPDVIELAYDRVPLACVVSMNEALPDVQAGLATITCPVLLIISDNDHVVLPEMSSTVAQQVSGPVTEIRLANSFHVATLDLDRPQLEDASIAFIDGLA